MRRKTGQALSPSSEWCQWLAPSLAPLSFGACSTAAISDFESARALINSLQASVAAYLGTSFCFADLAIPERDQTYQRTTIEKALVEVGLRQSYPTNENSWRAVYANNIDHSNDPSSPIQSILAIDYNKAGLRLSLFADEHGLIDGLRQDYYPSLGSSHNQAQKHWDKVAEIVREFLKPPFRSTPDFVKVPDRVKHIVLYGDAVPDDELAHVLNVILGADLAENAYSVDPIFIAAIGGADGSHAAQDDLHFKYTGRKAALVCQWRSKLYYQNEGRREL